MARIPYVEKGTADPEIRKLYEGFEAQFGVRGVPNVAKALANLSPAELRSRADSLKTSYLDQGVTFDIGGEERAFLEGLFNVFAHFFHLCLGGRGALGLDGFVEA